MTNIFQSQYNHWLNTENPSTRERAIMKILLDGLKHLGEDHLALVPGEEGTALVILKEPHPSEDYGDLELWDSKIKNIAIAQSFHGYTIAFDTDHQHVEYYGPMGEGNAIFEAWMDLENSGADQDNDERFKPAWEAIGAGLLKQANKYLSDRAIPVSTLLVHKQTGKTVWLGTGPVKPEDLPKDLEHNRKWGFQNAEQFAKDDGVDAYDKVIRVRSWSGQHDTDYSVADGILAQIPPDTVS
ncbi:MULTISPECIES: hypothetical protein [Acidithiobacillus]|uniref:Uncharacterized protein n=2 Tax=Acidithiobacillus TaxID=119977 RepID=A0A179BNK9_ACIFR|nr:MULTISPECIES: hypothetical protein [Acidithiobacillus]MEB8488181.1 hypothetical protein [Acidithiobacillus ferriphilus]MEB8488767.1 hypothetical protein [Acidithiobacillus ferriphilus]MEB8492211.1 hypothetical protein [Acidithiobacillus ferriphilus]MEB8513514.1 hypothetical protein [Acidithiobacillus ferriphilus]MEB8521656.1 hypothetical protein [Acidithiobacillus ferriphilus]